MLSFTKYKIVLVFLFLQFFVIQKQNLLIAQTLDVLFIGNSFTGWNDMPSMVARLSEGKEQQLVVGKNLLYGRTLYEISQSANLERKINSKNWDYIIAQDSPYPIAYPIEFISTSPFRIAMNRIIKLAKQNYSGTEIMIFMPWAYEDGKFWDEDNPENYFEMQEKIYDNTLLFADELNVKIAPVGHVWKEILAESQSMDLFISDFAHPTILGSYTAACVLYSTIVQEKINSPTYDAGIQADTAKYLQEISSRIVNENLDVWNLVTSISRIEYDDILDPISFPNPFNAQTTILFSLKTNEYVSLEIFNSIGKKIETVYSGKLAVGEYSFKYDAQFLSSGVYYYRLQGKSINVTKPMILIK